jgi:hypothetical protein
MAVVCWQSKEKHWWVARDCRLVSAEAARCRRSHFVVAEVKEGGLVPPAHRHHRPLVQALLAD